MLSIYDNITKLAKRNGFTNLSELCDAAGVSRQVMTELRSGRTQKFSAKTAEKLCAVLHITLDELYGIPTVTQIRDDDIKFALFGGDAEEITDEMFEEVKRFAQFVRAREKEKKEDDSKK